MLHRANHGRNTTLLTCLLLAVTSCTRPETSAPPAPVAAHPAPTTAPQLAIAHARLARASWGMPARDILTRAAAIERGELAPNQTRAHAATVHTAWAMHHLRRAVGVAAVAPPSDPEPTLATLPEPGEAETWWANEGATARELLAQIDERCPPSPELVCIDASALASRVSLMSWLAGEEGPEAAREVLVRGVIDTWPPVMVLTPPGFRAEHHDPLVDGLAGRSFSAADDTRAIARLPSVANLLREGSLCHTLDALLPFLERASRSVPDCSPAREEIECNRVVPATSGHTIGRLWTHDSQQGVRWALIAPRSSFEDAYRRVRMSSLMPIHPLDGPWERDVKLTASRYNIALRVPGGTPTALEEAFRPYDVQAARRDDWMHLKNILDCRGMPPCGEGISELRVSRWHASPERPVETRETAFFAMRPDGALQDFSEFDVRRWNPEEDHFDVECGEEAVAGIPDEVRTRCPSLATRVERSFAPCRARNLSSDDQCRVSVDGSEARINLARGGGCGSLEERHLKIDLDTCDFSSVTVHNSYQPRVVVWGGTRRRMAPFPSSEAAIPYHHLERYQPSSDAPSVTIEGTRPPGPQDLVTPFSRARAKSETCGETPTHPVRVRLAAPTHGTPQTRPSAYVQSREWPPLSSRRGYIEVFRRQWDRRPLSVGLAYWTDGARMEPFARGGRFVFYRSELAVGRFVLVAHDLVADSSRVLLDLLIDGFVRQVEIVHFAPGDDLLIVAMRHRGEWVLYAVDHGAGSGTFLPVSSRALPTVRDGRLEYEQRLPSGAACPVSVALETLRTDLSAIARGGRE